MADHRPFLEYPMDKRNPDRIDMKVVRNAMRGIIEFGTPISWRQMRLPGYQRGLVENQNSDEETEQEQIFHHQESMDATEVQRREQAAQYINHIDIHVRALKFDLNTDNRLVA